MGLFKKKDYFFQSFVDLLAFAKEEIKLLQDEFKDFTNVNLLNFKNSIHAVEHQADIKKREIEEKLAKEFITSIDREDIFVLLDNIDDLIDSIDEISYKLYIRNYNSLPPNINIFVEKASEAIDGVIKIFENFESINDKKVMDPLIENVLNIEEEVDKLYELSAHKLYVENLSYDQARLGERVYSYFEYITDKARDICKHVYIVIYKNL